MPCKSPNYPSYTFVPPKLKPMVFSELRYFIRFRAPPKRLKRGWATSSLKSRDFRFSYRRPRGRTSVNQRKSDALLGRRPPYFSTGVYSLPFCPVYGPRTRPPGALQQMLELKKTARLKEPCCMIFQSLEWKIIRDPERRPICVLSSFACRARPAERLWRLP